MKVKMTKHSRETITIAQADAAKEIVNMFRQGEDTAEEYVGHAAHMAGMINYKVIQASAEMDRNCRARDRYIDDSGDLDIWLTGIVMGDTYDRASGKAIYLVYDIGAYLSDVLDGMGEDDAYNYTRRFYLRKYVEQR